MEFRNPILPGFNPDPSVVRVNDVYYAVTSTFEYLPGLPVYRSTDLTNWEQIGNVATRPEQVEIGLAPTNTGVYAPTIRFRDGVFYVIVTIVASPRGCVLFTTTDPAGTWDDGRTVEGVHGIDPDLAWDESGNAYVTYSTGAGGIQQVRVDLDDCRALEPPRDLWSGTGLQFPESPHVFAHEDHWYLLLAEGGTEAGHAVSLARGPSIEGPFESDPQNPILTAAGTGRAVQCTGHSDLVQLPNGAWGLILLGVRPIGPAGSFVPLGRETFITGATWVDGWLRVDPVMPNTPLHAEVEDFSFHDAGSLSDPGWLAVRTSPEEIASVVAGRLVLHGDGTALHADHPRFIGRRQRRHFTDVVAEIDVSSGAGGLALRSDERHHVLLEARSADGHVVVTATAVLNGIQQTWTARLPAGVVRLRMQTRLSPAGFGGFRTGGDLISLTAAVGDAVVQLCELDGRYWTSDTCALFTGRVVGMFAREGAVHFLNFRQTGSDTRLPPDGDK